MYSSSSMIYNCIAIYSSVGIVLCLVLLMHMISKVCMYYKSVILYTSYCLLSVKV